MSNSNICKLSYAMTRFVREQWQTIDRLFQRIDVATREELDQLEKAKLSLEYIMATGDVFSQEEREKLEQYRRLEFTEGPAKETQAMFETRMSTYASFLPSEKQSAALNDTPAIHPEKIEVTQGLAREHIQIMREVLGGKEGAMKGFKECILPSFEDLKGVGDTYFQVMYPDIRTHAGSKLWAIDNEKKLNCYRGRWDKNTLYSFREDIKITGGHLFLIDTAIKPEYTNGTQQYVTLDGSPDPLLPLLKEFFGEANAHRFNKKEIDLLESNPTKRKDLTTFIAFVTEKINVALHKAYQTTGLPKIHFKVMLVPLPLANMFYISTPEGNRSSQTRTRERSSTFDRQVGSTDESSSTYFYGHEEHGGAGEILSDSRSGQNEFAGFRLAVML